MLLLEEADARDGVLDRGSALEVAVLVVLLQDLVDCRPIQGAVVVKVLQHPVQFLQPELQLAVLAAHLGQLFSFTAQFAKVVHLHSTGTPTSNLRHIAVVAEGALHLLLDIPLIHHLDFIEQLLEEGLLLLREFLQRQRTNKGILPASPTANRWIRPRFPTRSRMTVSEK